MTVSTPPTPHLCSTRSPTAACPPGRAIAADARPEQKRDMRYPAGTAGKREGEGLAKNGRSRPGDVATRRPTQWSGPIEEDLTYTSMGQRRCLHLRQTISDSRSDKDMGEFATNLVHPRLPSRHHHHPQPAEGSRDGA
jgi:hypothetical protein